MKIFAIASNVLALLGSIVTSYFLFLAGWMLRSSHSSYDNNFGLLVLLLIPVVIGLPALGLYFSGWKQGRLFWIGLGLGALCLLSYIGSLFVFPEVLSLMAMP